jgi:ubiquinone/menaquinone biosynthesis C-methylase UbiE
MGTVIKQGDFTGLAKDYSACRPNYSETVLRNLRRHTGATSVADVGAGTGIWSRMLSQAGLAVNAVEPNDDMRGEGIRFSADYDIAWNAGSAENTGLADGSVNWVTMASSFHWADTPKAQAEFHRILKPGGHLTVLWNPRNIDGNELHEKIEQLVHNMVPNLKRVSSGRPKNSRDWTDDLQSTGHFTNCIFTEACHEIAMSHERYLGAWRSVNDIQAQAGPENFELLLKQINDAIRNLNEIIVPYKTRAWTVQKKES